MASGIRNTLHSVIHGVRASAHYYVEFLIAVLLLAQGAYELQTRSQLPSPDTFIYISSPLAEVVLGVLQVVSAGLIFGGLLTKDVIKSAHLRRWGLFLAFLAFSFLTVVAVISNEVNGLYWLGTLALAGISGGGYLRLGWEIWN